MRHLSDEEIQDFLEGETGNREAIAAHLSACPECRMELSLYRELYQQMAADGGFQLSPGFADRILQKAGPPPRDAAHWPETAVVISVLLAGLGTLFYLLYPEVQLVGLQRSLLALGEISQWMATRLAGLLMLSGAIVALFGNLDKIIAVFQHLRTDRV